MTEIKIPAAAEELRDRLTAGGMLATAKRWERAAIVFAYTEVGERGVSRWRQPVPPKMFIRQFAALGIVGLTTNKAVSRYRDAWVNAISNGWAVPVDPGDTVVLPEQDFPEWPYGEGISYPGHDEEEDDDLPPVPLPRLRDRRGPNRPFAVRLVSRLDTATADLKRLADTAPDEALTDENRAQLVERLTNLMFQVQNALTALGLVEDMEKRPG
jgi:hypothetical protein